MQALQVLGGPGQKNDAETLEQPKSTRRKPDKQTSSTDWQLRFLNRQKYNNQVSIHDRSRPLAPLTNRLLLPVFDLSPNHDRRHL